VANTRPSAAEVTYRLSDLIASANMSVEPAQPLGEDVQDRARKVIQAAANTNKVEGSRIGKDDVALLCSFAKNGDPTAAYLLGTAIWFEVAEPVAAESDNGFGLLLVAGIDPNIGEATRFPKILRVPLLTKAIAIRNALPCVDLLPGERVAGWH